jgi:hypothetical protein
VRRGHSDLTQKAIVRALRDAGRSVVILTGVGNGVPDLLVGWGGNHMRLMEVKSGKDVHHMKNGGLRDTQVKFCSTWKGAPVRVVSTVAEALSETGVWIGRPLGNGHKKIPIHATLMLQRTGAAPSAQSSDPAASSSSASPSARR